MCYHRRTCQNKNMNASKPCININIIELLIELSIDHPPSQGGGVTIVTMLHCQNVKTFIVQVQHSYTYRQPTIWIGLDSHIIS